MGETHPEPATCEVCGTGLCAEAQGDGVPCTGTGTLCSACAKGGAHQARLRAASAPREVERNCLDRAGL